MTAPLIVTKENLSTATKGTPPFFKLMATVSNRMDYGVINYHLPDGRVLRFDSQDGSGEEAHVYVRDFAMARKTVFGGTIGFYESYAAEQWDTPDLAQCLYVFAKNADAIQEQFMGNPVLRTMNNVVHAMNKNSKKGSKKNIMAHYDLGNSFYEKWLDPSMTYSSALFDTPETKLEAAQTAKYRSLAEQISLRPDEEVLEIGSGWGGFAEYAAKEVGAKVTGVTISPEQYDYACERMFREGLNDKVEIRLQDYRDVSGTFDKIASIEMFEAVGKEYWPVYFNKVHENLKADGRAGLQIITIADRFYPFYVKAADFIQRYVFPGGMLPSPTALNESVEQAGMKIENTVSFGLDYARTLNQWHAEFLEKWDEITPLGFDDRFKKLWQFYLAYCEAGFRAQSTDVCQVTLAKA